MDLKSYIEKRDFSKTTEPESGISNDENHLMFVVQKHQASHLHYDFRLEMDGVLKSWAIPKGPSTNPKVKHLAMMVEDHPYDYRNFEGTIPQGEYGGGTVIVWDQGYYEPIDSIVGKQAQEKYLLNQLKSGSIKIKLYGQKLKGEFALVKTQGMGENGWLLIKHNDAFASMNDITLQNTSVLSNLNIEEMAVTGGPTQKKAELTPLTETIKLKKPGHAALELTQKQGPLSENKFDIAAILGLAPSAGFPRNIKPMKPTLVSAAFDDAGWLFEVKWDGYRAIAEIAGDNANLVSRNDKYFEHFQPINQIMRGWKMNAVIDGEIVVLNDQGVSDFGALQNWRSDADGILVYYVFDLLWYEGKNLMALPLNQRQGILLSILPTSNNHIRQSKAFYTHGIELFSAAEQLGLEGIVAKKVSSHYTIDLRSKEWLKIKVQRRQEVVIAGFTTNTETVKPFSALILGVYEGADLRYVGKVGTGFSIKMQNEMIELFKHYIAGESPFSSLTDEQYRKHWSDGNPTWLKPELVCEVNFAEVTTEGLFRQASFKGMRVDKMANEVVLETPKPTNELLKGGLPV